MAEEERRQTIRELGWLFRIDTDTVMDEHDVFTSAMGFIFDLGAVKSDSMQFVHGLPLRKAVHKVRHTIVVTAASALHTR